MRKMPELFIMLEGNKEDIANAIKIKSSLEGKGVFVSGMLLVVDGSSLKFIEDLTKIPMNPVSIVKA
jgi:hypothetical protein